MRRNNPGHARWDDGRYRGLVEAGQIRFVTFHQSYAYEDFVEGLRPETGASEDGTGFRLEPRRGIFREIATLAEQARKKGSPSAPFDLAGRHVYKMSLGRAGSEDYIYEAAILGGYAALGWGGSEDWSDPKYENYQAVFDRWNQIEPGTSGNSGNIAQLWRFRSMQPGDLIVVSDGNLRFRAIGEVTGPYRYNPTDAGDYAHRRDVRWLLVLKEPLPWRRYRQAVLASFLLSSCQRVPQAGSPCSPPPGRSRRDRAGGARPVRPRHRRDQPR